MKKRIVSILLCLCMVLGMMPLSVFAANDNCDHSYEYGYYYFDDAGHYLWCDHCTYYPEDSLEAHVNEDDDVHCDVCGYIYPHTHIYEENAYSGYDNLHYPSCDLCGEDDETAAEHHFDTDSDDLCDACHVFMGNYNLVVTNGEGHERADEDDVFFGDTLTAEYSDTVEYWWTVYDPNAGGEGENYTLSNEKSYTIKEEDFEGFEEKLNLFILNPVTKETLEYCSFYVIRNYDALPKVNVDLYLKAVDADGVEIDCQIDALLNNDEWIGTENLEYGSASCVVGENTVSDWDLFPYGYVFPDYEIHFICNEAGSIAVTSDNARVEVDGYTNYLVLTLEPKPPVNTVLEIGDNEIQDGYTYTYTAQQDGTLYATVTELYYRYWGNNDVPEEKLNEWVGISINGTDIVSFANQLEVSAGDVVTIYMESLDSDTYMGNINLSWDGPAEGPDLTPAEITDVFLVVDGVTYASGTVTIKPFSTISYMVVGTNLENLTGQERVAYAQGYDIPVDSSFGWNIEPDLNTATWDITYLASAFKDCDNFEVKYKNDGDADWTGTGLYLIYDADASLPLVLGDNAVKNDIPYTYTAESDGTLQLNVTELFYDNGEGSGAVTEDLLGEDLAIRINGNDVTAFSNTLEVSAGDTVTLFVDAIALYTYEGTVNLAFTAAEPDAPEDTTPAKITNATITVDGVTYNEGILKVTSKSTVVFTLNGTNFANLSESNVLNYAPGKEIPLTDEAFVVDTVANTATWTLSAPPTQLEGCNLFDPTYRNDIHTQTSTGHQLIYQIDTQETAGKVLIELTDRYGDGWNGAALEVYQDGVLVETLTIDDGSYNIIELPYDEDASYSFKWNQGRYSEECGFTIHVNGEIVYEISDASSLKDDETFLTYENGAVVDPEDFPARITGVTITVDGETYTEGEVTIKPDSTVIYTVTGENFANMSQDNGLYFAPGNSEPLTYEGFVVDAEADTATWDVTSQISLFEDCDNFEVQYTNDDASTWVGTGIYLTYEEPPACTHADILACEKICAKCGQEVQPDAKHVSNSAPCMDGVCVYGCGTAVPAASDHTPAEAVRENEKAATCYAEGSYDEVVYCSVVECKHEISRTPKTVGKLAHTPAKAVRENEKAATCYAEGSYDEVVYCSVVECKHEISRTPNTVAKVKHTPAVAVRENEKASTCYAEGSYDEIVYCSVEECKHEISRTPKTVGKLAHTPAKAVRENEKAATCYAEGAYDEVIYCSVAECKHEISRTPKTIEKLTHTPAEAVRENEKTATCSTEGSYEMAVYCAECDEEISRTKHTIPTKDHTVVIDKAVEATCTAAGKTEGKHCSVCGEVIVAQQEIPAKSHTVVPDAAVEATCTTAGKTSGSHCSVCGEVIMAQVVIPAAGHSWVEATCTTPKTCAVCGITTGGVVHGYDHAFDYKCDACGTTRIVDMTRPMVDMFRMYNPNTGEHFYTGSTEERDNLIAVGWQYEGVGFTFPLTTGKPVHRLFQPSTGEHVYTMDEEEKAKLMAEGWNYEGIAFNSGFENEVPQYRLHNPNATVGAYHFTASLEEKNNLLAAGWEYQGIGWYSMGA